MRALTISQNSYTAEQVTIMSALTATVVLREGQASKPYLHQMGLELSKENVSVVLAALEELGRTERAEGESAVPSLGRVLREVRRIENLSHPLAHLREIITKLARIFNVKADEDFLILYQEEAGHRTDADLDKAYKAIRGDDTLKKMPTPGQFRAQCGIPRIYRDGTRPA